jgi:hypothetical protein
MRIDCSQNISVVAFSFVWASGMSVLFYRLGQYPFLFTHWNIVVHTRSAVAPIAQRGGTAKYHCTGNGESLQGYTSGGPRSAPRGVVLSKSEAMPYRPRALPVCPGSR